MSSNAFASATRFLKWSSRAAAACVAVLAAGTPVQGATYSARGDFSLASNPNGVWSYGTLSTFTGGALTLFNTTATDAEFTGQRTWDNNGSFPNRAADTANFSGTQVTDGTVVVPPNQLILDSQGLIAAVRWTAPAAGTYNVTGLFQRDDTSAAPVSVRIVENGTTTLFMADNFTTNGSQQLFALSSLVLPAGTTLDFAEGAGQANNDSTGLQATISTVPEPSSIALGLIGATSLACWRRRAKRR